MRSRTVICTLAACGGALLGLYSFRDSAKLEKQNFRGRTVHLRGGIGVAASATAAAAASSQPGFVMSVGAAAIAGLIDDLDNGVHDGDAPAKGLRGHLSALARGQVTTGVLKIIIIGVGGAASGTALACCRYTYATPLWKLLSDAIINTVTIAAWANLLNLLDLRPGRALKAASLLAAPLAVSDLACSGSPAQLSAQLAGGALAASAVVAPSDLGETTMLGDTGANALGALLGAALAAQSSAVVRLLAGGSAVVLILASEKVSFSEVIAAQPLLAAVDAWGREA